AGAHHGAPAVLLNGRPGGNRTPNLRFWRPPLCQLSYWPVNLPEIPGDAEAEGKPPASAQPGNDYSMTLATTPAPTVRPPSRMAKRRPSSIAIGEISVTTILMLSPVITISSPSGSSTEPVTSVVRK